MVNYVPGVRAAQADVQKTGVGLASKHSKVFVKFAFGPPCRPFQANNPMLSAAGLPHKPHSQAKARDILGKVIFIHV